MNNLLLLIFTWKDYGVNCGTERSHHIILALKSGNMQLIQIQIFVKEESF